MWSMVLFQCVSNAGPWYNGTLLIAVVTAAISFVLGQISTWRRRRQAEQDRRLTLLSAFHAEVTVIRNELRPLVEDIVGNLEARQPLLLSKWGRRMLPTVVYRYYVKSYGELRDSNLVELIVTLYSRLESIEARERLLLEAQESLNPDYLAELVAGHRFTQKSIFDTARTLSYKLALALSPQPAKDELAEQFDKDDELSEKAGQLLKQFLGLEEK